jgi:hypothetical protein
MFRKSSEECLIENEIASMRLERVLARPSVHARSMVIRRLEPVYERRSML